MGNKEEFEKLYSLIEGLYTHTQDQYTELRVEISDLKTDVAEVKTDVGELKTEVTNNGEAIRRLEQEVKSMNKTIANHDLDIQVLKKAFI